MIPCDSQQPTTCFLKLLRPGSLKLELPWNHLQICHEKGHLSYNCPPRSNAQDNIVDNTAETSPSSETDNPPEHTETVADSHTKPSTDTMATELEESASSESGNGPIDTPPKDTSMADPEDSQFSGLRRSHAQTLTHSRISANDETR